MNTTTNNTNSSTTSKSLSNKAILEILLNYCTRKKAQEVRDLLAQNKNTKVLFSTFHFKGRYLELFGLEDLNHPSN